MGNCRYNIITCKPQQNNSFLLTSDVSSFSLIWLHGQSQSAATYQQLFKNQNSPAISGRVRLVNAPLYLKKNSYKWFSNILGRQFSEEYKKQIKKSTEQIEKNIKAEVDYWEQKKKKQKNYPTYTPYQKIYLGGVDQGGYMSLIFGLNYQHILAGLFSFNGQFDYFSSTKNIKSLPISLYHGKLNKKTEETSRLQYQRILLHQQNVEYHIIQDGTHEFNGSTIKYLTEDLKKLQGKKK